MNKRVKSAGMINHYVYSITHTYQEKSGIEQTRTYLIKISGQINASSPGIEAFE